MGRLFLYKFIPKIISLGMEDSRQKMLFASEPFFHRRYQIFYFFALSMLILRAGVVYDRQLVSSRKSRKILFLDIDKRTYQRDIAPIHMARRHKS